MKQIQITWKATHTESHERRVPKPLPGLTVTFDPILESVISDDTTLFLTTERGVTNNRGELEDGLLGNVGVWLPDVPATWLVSIYGSSKIETFTFYMNPHGKGDVLNLAEFADFPDTPEDDKLNAWLDIAFQVNASLADAREQADRAQREADRAQNAPQGEKGPDGEPGKDGDPGRNGEDIRNVIRMTPDKFPGIDNTGETATSAALQTALNTLAPHVTAIFDGTYRINSQIAWPLNRYYDMSAATIIVDTGTYDGGAAFIARQAFDTPRNVSILTEVSITIDDVTGVRVARATVPGYGSEFRKNDTVKVFSDDVIPGGHFTSNDRKPRQGEFAKVHSVVGDVVTLRSTFVDPFVNNIRIAKLPPATVTFNNPTFDVTDEVVASKLTVHFIRLTGLTKPKVVNPTWKRLMGMGVSAKSCDGYEVSGASCDFAINEESTSSFGYGIHDSSSRDGRITGGQFNSMRHGYTDGTNFSLAGSPDPADYGATMNTKVSDSIGRYCTAGAFDTHSMAYGVEFNNVTSYSASNTHGVQLRGRNCSVNGLLNYGGYSAVFLFTQATTSGGASWSPGESYGHTLNGITTHGSTMVLYVRIRTDATHPFYDQRTVAPTCVANDVTAWNTPNLINSQNGKIAGANWNWLASKNLAGSVLSLQNTDLDLRGITYDMSGVETISSTAYLSNIDASSGGRAWSSRVRITDGKVIDNAFTLANLTPLYRAANTATGRVELRDHYAPTRPNSAAFSSIAGVVAKRVRWYNDTADFTS